MSRIVAVSNQPGKCRVCGCSELKPCLEDDGPGRPLIPCSWIDAGKTLCSSLECVAVIPLDELVRLSEEAA